MSLFGRNRPLLASQLHFHDYVNKRKSAVSPPSSIDWSAKCQQPLRNVYKNDTLGCCVIAGGWHIFGVNTGNAGDLVVATDAQIIQDYGFIGGYVNGNPSTDNGCDEITAFNWWQKNGFAGVS